MKVMKSTLLLLGVLLSSQSFSAQTTTVKVADGTTAYCKSQKDVNSRKNAIGLYRVKTTSAKIIEDSVQVELELSFLKCTQKKRGFSFEYTPPFNENSLFQNLFGKEVRISKQAIEIKAYKDGVYSLLFNEELSKNEARQKLTMTLPIEEVLNDATENRTKYAASFDVFMLKYQTFERVDGSASAKKKSRYGSYRIHMEMNLEKNTVTLK